MSLRSFSFLVLLTLFLAACRRDDGVPSWQADALIPLVQDDLGIDDLVADSLLATDPDGTLRLVYASNLLRVNLVDEGIEVPDTSLTVSVSLETLVLEDRTIETRISLGQLLQTVPGGPLLILLINTGSPVSIPAISDITTGPVPIDATAFFQTADIDSGFLDIEVFNGLAADLTDALFVLRDPVGGFEVLRDSFDVIPAGGTVFSSSDLAGLTVNGLLEAELVRVSSPGTTSPVSMDTADAVTITAAVRGVKVTEATAIFPAQDLVSSNTDVLYDLGGPEVTRMSIRSGNVVIQVVNTIGDSIYIDYAIPGATGPDGASVFFQAVVPPPPSGGSIFIEETFDLAGYEIDLRGPDQNSFNTFANEFQARIDSTGVEVSIALSDSIRVNYGLENIVPEALYGYAGQADFELDETVSFDFTQGISSGSLDLEALSLRLTLVNEQGVEGEVTLDELTASNSTGGGMASLVAPSVIGQPIAVNRALSNPFTAGVTVLDLDETNSNVDELIEATPDLLTARGRVSINPNGNTFGYQDFVLSNNNLDLNAELDMPLSLTANGMTIVDTFDFSLFEESDDPTIVIRGGTLFLTAENGFPLEANMQVLFLDEAGAVLTTLFTELATLPPGLLGPDCRVNEAGPFVTEIPIDETDIDLVRAASQVRVFAELTTTETPTCDGFIRIYSDYTLSFTLAATLSLDVIADF